MTAPIRPTSRLRLLSTKKFRIALLVGLVVIAATVLSSTNSFAGSLSQKLFASAAAIIGGSNPLLKRTHHSVALEFVEAAQNAELDDVGRATRSHSDALVRWSRVDCWW